MENKLEGAPLTAVSRERAGEGSAKLTTAQGPVSVGTDTNSSSLAGLTGPMGGRSTREAVAAAIRELKEELQVDDLQIHGVIARGGFGTVYRGESFR